MDQLVALVTGATGGLGPAVTEAFTKAGYLVVGTSRSAKGAGEIAADLTEEDAAVRLVQKVIERHGRIDAVIDVMGGWRGGKSVAETDDHTWSAMLSLNLESSFRLYRAALPHLHTSPRGRLLSVGSKAGLGPSRNSAAYAAAKAALHSLVLSIAAESPAATFTSNVIAPGTIDTEANRKAMPKADRAAWVAPVAIAELLVWLASEHGGHVNGAVLPIG